MLHPALPDCPGHEVWKRDFKGSSGLFSFELKSGDPAAFVDSLELFGIGYSWGGYESLAIPSTGHTVSKSVIWHDITSRNEVPVTFKSQTSPWQRWK